MTTATAKATDKRTTTQVFQIFIKANPKAVWDAITRPEWTRRYGYQAPSEYELRPGGRFRSLASDAMRSMGGPEVVIDGEVLECDAPHRLVQTWRALWDPAMIDEGFTRLTWELAEGPAGVTKLTVTHELEGAPITAAQVSGQIPEAGGGWSFVLSDLKTVLETGKTLEG